MAVLTQGETDRGWGGIARGDLIVRVGKGWLTVDKLQVPNVGLQAHADDAMSDLAIHLRVEIPLEATDTR